MRPTTIRVSSCSYLTLPCERPVSFQLEMKRNDFLRQVVTYEYPRHHWEKDNFALHPEHRPLVQDVVSHPLFSTISQHNSTLDLRCSNSLRMKYVR